MYLCSILYILLTGFLVSIKYWHMHSKCWENGCPCVPYNIFSCFSIFFFITLMLIELFGLSGVQLAVTSSFCIWAFRSLLFWLMFPVHEWEISYNAVCCPCLYILSTWMHLLFTTPILIEKKSFCYPLTC